MQNHVPSESLLSQHNPEAKTDVLLVTMPFGPLLTPSLGLSLLKGSLTYHNISTKVLYFTLQLAKLISTSLYLFISRGNPATYDLLGEWLFRDTLFGSDPTGSEKYIEDILRGKLPAHGKNYIVQKPLSENLIQDLLCVRDQVEDFLERCLQQIADHSPKIVAFTSVFQQQLAALSLAKKLKEKFPETFILMGGANCEGIMGVEIIRQFNFVDAVISGEGDIVFPQLVQCLLKNKPYSNLQGVYAQKNIELISSTDKYLNAPSMLDMDSLPIPNYGD
jgi:hypothetical protein